MIAHCAGYVELFMRTYIGSVAAKKYPVVVDPATEKAVFEDSRETVTPEDVVRDFLQELTGV